jgi:hypothetical protein
LGLVLDFEAFNMLAYEALLQITHVYKFVKLASEGLMGKMNCMYKIFISLSLSLLLRRNSNKTNTNMDVVFFQSFSNGKNNLINQ